MGRPKKPANLRLLQGNPGRVKINKKQPEPDVVIPEPSMPLNGYALEEWNRIAPILERLGLISELDSTELTMYCFAWQELRGAAELLEKSSKLIEAPSGYPMQNPLYQIINRQAELCHKFLCQFGMTPASRSHVETMKKKSEEPFKKFKKF